MNKTFKTVAKIALYQSAQPRIIRTTRTTRITRTNWMSLFALTMAGTAIVAIATFLGCAMALASMFS